MEDLPAVCRDIMVKYSIQVQNLGDLLLELLSEALGLKPGHLKDMDCGRGLDHIGGLQVLHEDKWIDVPYSPGALVINIGDLLQLISNDAFLSVEHRVLASSICLKFAET
ncbi:hypothetical protein V6N13_050701 [Hibiscus sabdariffa]